MSDGFNSWYQAGMFTFSTALARQKDPLAFIEGLNNGTETMIGNKKFIELASWVQEEFKYSQDPLGVDFNTQTSAFTSGRAPLVIGGSWLQSTIDAVDPNMDIGMFSYPFTEDPVENDYLYSYVGPIWHVNSDASDDEIVAAKEFINWLIYDETGRNYLTTEMKAIPGITNVTPDFDAIGELGRILYEYMQKGKTKGTYNALYPQGTGGAILFGDAICAVAAGKYTVDEFIAEAQRIWDSTK
jgi:raffinose/stachyose/melibiose transport system substrate-binding protein